MKNSFNIFLFFATTILISSCGINSAIMLKTPKGERAAHYDSIPMQPKTAYVISVDDKIRYQLYTNQGEALLLSNADVSGRTIGAEKEISYTVDREGMIELPKLGKVHVVGLTVAECEDLLESLYGTEYLQPFVQVQITNQRVLVFPGGPGEAKVVPLENNNTTLMEALATAGGLSERGKANTIKLMRREGNERKVYAIDLSTIDGLAYADMIVQANDYIYVEPAAKISREIVKDVAPIVSIISSSLVIVTVISNLK